MKNTFILLIIISLCVYLYLAFVRRSPESIFKEQLNVELKDFDYSIKSFHEQWDANGDGYCCIVIKFNNDKYKYEILNKNNTFKPLPILIKLSPNDIPKGYTNMKNGYYSYSFSEKDRRNFKIGIINFEQHEFLLYYQIE